MNDLLHQLLGIAITLVSTGVFVVRYGIPSTGMSLGYLAFGTGFVAAGVAMGKMLQASTMSLLLLEQWHFNLSLMAIGYSVLFSGLIGVGTALWKIFPRQKRD